MTKSKKASVADTDEALKLANELNEITSIWRNTYMLSGDALIFVKEKVKAIVDSLSPGETEEPEA